MKFFHQSKPPLFYYLLIGLTFLHFCVVVVLFFLLFAVAMECFDSGDPIPKWTVPVKWIMFMLASPALPIQQGMESIGVRAGAGQFFLYVSNSVLWGYGIGKLVHLAWSREARGVDVEKESR